MTTLFENTDICNQSNLSQVEQVPNPISPVCYSPNPDSDDESS
jgi:hypothetical protein